MELGDPAGLLLSPCVGVCRIDPATGWCQGCARDDLELATWRDLDADARAEVWRDLPRRRALLGQELRLLPWSVSELIGRLASWSEAPGARWSMGGHGAFAELSAASGRLAVLRTADGLTLRTAGGAMRLDQHPGLRAFAQDDGRGGIGRVVLALHRSRLRAASHGISLIGPDARAVDPEERGQVLVDLGLGFANGAFCVRSADRGLLAALIAQSGQPLLKARPPLVPHLLAVAPDRVVTSPLGRIEVTGSILRRDSGGPRTHLLPELLAQCLEMPPGPALPEAYAPCATLHAAAEGEGCRGETTPL